VPLPPTLYQGADRAAFHDELLARVRALPGTSAAGATTALPLTLATNQRGVAFPLAPGNTGDERLDQPLADHFRVTPGYFAATGHRLLAGRDFDVRDADTTALNIVIDDVLAARFFPDGSAVGATALAFGDTATIVGVVDQARLYNVHTDDRGQVYVPFHRFPTTSLSYAVRTGADPIGVAPAVGAALRDLDPSVPMSQVRTLERIVDDSLGRQRLSLTLIAAFALGALLLAALGIYGVVANAVVRRTQEIGLRMALGASADSVVRLVLGRGLALAGTGALVGLVGAAWTSRLVAGVMVGVDATDPLVYAGVAAGLVAVAAIAAYVPARRATRIDPLEALRPD
jgi:predicted permease